jgi:hypothetical protein
MINVHSNTNAKCCRCNHYGFCQIYWGMECKRQGGKRIPRLKMRHLDKQNDSSKTITVQNHASSKLNWKDSEPIRTRHVNWAL